MHRVQSFFGKKSKKPAAPQAPAVDQAPAAAAPKVPAVTPAAAKPPAAKQRNLAPMDNMLTGTRPLDPNSAKHDMSAQCADISPVPSIQSRP